jgi:AraC-like DNA-binding protein
MLSIPLTFVIAFALGIFLIREIRKDIAWSPPRQAFALFIGLCLVHILLIGLVRDYSVKLLRPLLPVSASLIPLMAWASFSALAQGGSPLLARGFLVRLLPTVVIAILVFTFPRPIDLILIMLYLGYGVALWQAAQVGPDSLQTMQLHNAQTAYQALRAASVLLLANAVADGLILTDFEIYGGAHVPGLLSVLSVVILLSIGGVALTGTEISGPGQDERDGRPSGPPAASDLPEADHWATAAQIDALLQETRLYVDPNLTLIRLARKAGIPARDISAAINRCHGANVSQYVNQFRLKEACRLLETTDHSITDIHFNSGFQTKSNFNREFRRQFGCSPSDWRASHAAAREAGH